MKKIETTNITGLQKAPFIKATHDQYTETIQETTGAIIKGLMGSYITDDLIVLHGCVVAVTGGSIPGTGTATLTAGAIYLNGEIYQVDADAALATTNPQTLYWEVDTTYRSGDPFPWGDGVTRNLHRVDKLKLTAGTAGAGLANYDATTVKRGTGTKTIKIGDWDMDANASVNVAHGLDWTNIVEISAVIINDTNNTRSMLQPILTLLPGLTLFGGGGCIGYDSTNVILRRFDAADAAKLFPAMDTPAFFDNIGYDSTGYNRGFINISFMV